MSPGQKPADMLPRSTPSRSGPAKPPTPTSKGAPRKKPSSPVKRDRRLRKGLIIASVFVLIFFMIVLILAAAAGGGENALTRAMGLSGDLTEILSKFINIIFGVADVVALVGLVIGGFVYIVAMGDPKEVHRAHKILIISFISLFVISIVWGILVLLLNAQINPIVEPGGPSNQIITNPSPAQGSAPFTVTFDIVGVPEENYFFSWDFTDGSSGTGKVIQHTFRREGYFQPVVTITDAQAQTTIIKTQVFVSNTKPIAVILTDPIKGRAPLEVNFDASDSSDPNGELVEYSWDFGDPNSSIENASQSKGSKASHTFTRDGSYKVTLVVTDNNNEISEVASQTIEVGEAPDIPTARITTTPPFIDVDDTSRLTGTPPFKVNFSGAKSHDSDGQIVNYESNFGDGSPGETGQTAIHTYEELGTYIVTLSVTDDDDKTDSITLEVLVKEPSKPPIAVIGSNPPPTATGEIKGTVPLTISLDGGDSYDQDGNIVLYEWNLGDNSPLQNAQVIEYTYETTGEHTIMLTVIDNDDNRSEPAEIKIKALSPGQKNPIARVVTSPVSASGNVPFTISFDASSSEDPDGTIITYKWDFGDGTVIPGGANVTHIYETIGIYQVKLTVIDNEGLTDSFEMPVAALLAAPVAKIKVNKSAGPAPLTVKFDGGTSTGSITRWEWDFGNGIKEQGRQVQYTFSSSGTYSVTLVVQDISDQVDTEKRVIAVE